MIAETASPVHRSAEPPRRGAGRWLRDRRVGVKIGLVVGACLALMVVQGINDLVSVGRLAATSDLLYQEAVKGESALGEARADVNRMRQRVLLHVLADPATKTRRQREIEELDAAFDRAVADLRPTGAVPAADLDAWVGAVQDYRAFRDRTILPASIRGVSGEELAAVLAECDRRFLPVEEGGIALSKTAVDQAAADEDRARSSAASARTMIVVLLLAGLVTGSVLAAVVTRMIVRPLGAVRRVLDAVAEGDLTQTAEVDSADEPGLMAQALGRATTSVRSTVLSLSESATQLAAASEELSANSTQIAAAASQTADETQVAHGAIEEISRNVRTVAVGAEEMSASIREIAQNASEAASVASEAVHAAASANAQVTKLGDSSAEIGQVVKVITAIAEQTNLLALNATIEAARAGEAGRGFAVVAGEVKQLAQDTARATGEIGQRVDVIQADAAAAIAVIGEIARIIERIDDYQTSIAGAVEEQTATTNEISQSVAVAAEGSERLSVNVARVASAASATTSGIAEAQRASEELARMSSQLQVLVDQFRC